MKKLLLVIWCIGSVLTGLSQTKDNSPAIDTNDLYNMSLEQLKRLKSKYAATDLERNINLAIDAASNNPLSLRKSPSIISVITDDEILKSGATNLLDVLKLIPGIQINVDVQGVLGLSFRGLWANEGNLMLRIDGMEFNETAYNTLQFNNHYPISNIKRIEVIRGPGSAIYGGTAEYAVINIMTKKASDLNGVTLGATVSNSKDGYAQQNISLDLGKKMNQFQYSLSGNVTRSITSNQNYTDVYGTGYNMNDISPTQTIFINGNVAYKNLILKFAFDDFLVYTKDGYQAVLSKPYPNYFRSYLGELKYTKKVSENLSLAIRYDYKQCTPWQNTIIPLPTDSLKYDRLNLNTYRHTANIMFNWDIKKWASANFGFEDNYDVGVNEFGDKFRNEQSNKVYYNNYAPFLQVLINSYIANVTFGARYDMSSSYGSAFNPRLGITKKLGNFNLKVLFASSFRAPSIQNIENSLYGNNLKPEQSNTFEFEVGAKLSPKMYISANVFDITTYNAIKYFVRNDTNTLTSPDGYRNAPINTGSTGFELEYKYKFKKGQLSVAYSYYTVSNKGVDSLNLVPGHQGYTLGLAPKKLTLLASHDIGKLLFATLSAQYLGDRYAVTAINTLGKGIPQLINNQLVINLFVGSNNLIKNGKIGLGVKNITDELILYPQAYNSLHAPLPGMGREFYIKLNYTIPAKGKQP